MFSLISIIFNIYICHSLEIWVRKRPIGLCIAVGNSWWGHWQICRQITVIPLHMHSAFPTERGKQTIVMSFNDVTMFAHASGRGYGRGYIRKACMSVGAVVWVFGTEHFSQLLGGHQPSVMAVLVPLVE